MRSWKSLRAPAARKSRIQISSRKSAKRSAASSSTSTWRRFALTVDAQDSSPAAALLETATGAQAAIEHSLSAADDGAVEFSRPSRGDVAADFSRPSRGYVAVEFIRPSRSDGAVGLARARTRITVYVPGVRAAHAHLRVAKMLAALRRNRALVGAKLEEADVRDESWASSWKKFYRPFLIAPQLYVAPSWERRFKAPRDSRVLWLDPGMAFGTGQHPTSQLAIKMLLDRVRNQSLMLDVGCGSGLLALAAAQRGARVYASDMDPIAIYATQANFAANKLKAQAIRRARDVPESFPRADLITANITARALVRLAPALARKLLPAGLLITSGVVENGRAHVLDAFGRAGLELVEERSAKNWYAHVYQKRARR